MYDSDCYWQPEGFFNPPTGPVKGIPHHRTHTNMGEVVQDNFIATPLALSLKESLGAHYNIKNAHQAIQAKDAD